MTEKKPTLYHSTSQAIQNDFITPFPGKTAVHAYISDATLQREHEGNFIFAGANRNAAYAYSLKNPHMRLVETMQKNAAPPITAVFIENRETFLKDIDKLEPKIFTIPEENNFSAVTWEDGTLTDEWISREKIPTSMCEMHNVGGVKDVMQQGAQVFFLRDGTDSLDWESKYGQARQKIYEEVRTHAKNGKTFDELAAINYDLWLQLIKSMVDSKLLIHENAERGISPLNFETGEIDRKFVDMHSLTMSTPHPFAQRKQSKSFESGNDSENIKR